MFVSPELSGKQGLGGLGVGYGEHDLKCNETPSFV
jgi:hypothetical protein